MHVLTDLTSNNNSLNKTYQATNRTSGKNLHFENFISFQLFEKFDQTLELNISVPYSFKYKILVNYKSVDHSLKVEDEFLMLNSVFVFHCMILMGKN